MLMMTRYRSDKSAITDAGNDLCWNAGLFHGLSAVATGDRSVAGMSRITNESRVTQHGGQE